MNKIRITKKDIEQITEACVKNILKEDFYQNDVDDSEEEFETDNEPYFDQRQNHRNIMIYLNNICKAINGSCDYDNGLYLLEEPENLIQIILRFETTNGTLSVYDVYIAKPIGSDVPETINAFNWGSQALTLLTTKQFKGQ